MVTLCNVMIDFRGGGVLLPISNTICSEQIGSPANSECLLVKVHTHKTIILCVVLCCVCSPLL